MSSSTPISPRPRRPLAALALAPALFLAAPAVARDYAARSVGGWTVAASKDGGGCFVTRAFARRGETALLFGQDADGRNHLSVLNANWSIAPGERLSLDYALDRVRYPGQVAIGIASEGKKGFVSRFDARFPARFAAARQLAVARGETPVERLDLTGSGQALAEMRRCLAAVGGAGAGAGAGSGDGRGAGAEADIPADPFAPDERRRRPRK